MLGLLGRGVLALADSVEESVDWQLNVVAGWKVVKCELRDVIFTLAVIELRLRFLSISIILILPAGPFSISCRVLWADLQLLS
jgi:hypothetical protein